MYIRAVFFFPLVLLGLLVASFAGTALRRRFPALIPDDQASQFTAVQAAVLALLGLLLGFSFSMGVARYDTRKNAEIAEANAIGSAFARTGSLAGDAAERQRGLMRLYVEARMRFYDAGTDWAAVADAERRGSALRREMVAGAEASLGPQRDAVSNGYLAALTEMGNTAETREAALENRIPAMAWGLLVTVSIAASFLVGLGVTRWHGLLLTVVPLVVAASLTLIWDLDDPRSGLIRVKQNSMHRVRTAVYDTPAGGG